MDSHACFDKHRHNENFSCDCVFVNFRALCVYQTMLIKINAAKIRIQDDFDTYQLRDIHSGESARVQWECDHCHHHRTPR